MRVIFTRPAQRQIKEALWCWRVNRTGARGMLGRELVDAYRQLRKQPFSGKPVEGVPFLNRLVLYETGYFLFHSVTEKYVVARELRHQSRASAPP